MWTERFHLKGSALITGGFFLKPVRRAQVEAQLLTRSLELRIGDDVVATDLAGHLAMTLHPFDPREVHGIDVSESMVAKLRGKMVLVVFWATWADPVKRDLPELVNTHYRQWVAYHGSRRLGFHKSKTALYIQWIKAGIPRDELLVTGIDRSRL